MIKEWLMLTPTPKIKADRAIRNKGRGKRCLKGDDHEKEFIVEELFPVETSGFSIEVFFPLNLNRNNINTRSTTIPGKTKE